MRWIVETKRIKSSPNYVRYHPGIINTIMNIFYSNVLLPDENGCMKYIGGKGHYGYGIFYDRSGQKRAHRFSYERHVGEIPKGLEVMHLCDNPSCVAPDHLRLGTHKENMNDCKRKKRNYLIPARYGEENNLSKLKAKDVIEIRKQLDMGYSIKNIANRFGVTTQNIRYIKLRLIWKNI